MFFFSIPRTYLSSLLFYNFRHRFFVAIVLFNLSILCLSPSRFSFGSGAMDHRGGGCSQPSLLPFTLFHSSPWHGCSHGLSSSYLRERILMNREMTMAMRSKKWESIPVPMTFAFAFAAYNFFQSEKNMRSLNSIWNPYRRKRFNKHCCSHTDIMTHQQKLWNEQCHCNIIVTLELFWNFHGGWRK